MRHHPENIPPQISYSGDIQARAVGIGFTGDAALRITITEENLLVGF